MKLNTVLFAMLVALSAIVGAVEWRAYREREVRKQCCGGLKQLNIVDSDRPSLGIIFPTR